MSSRMAGAEATCLCDLRRVKQDGSLLACTLVVNQLGSRGRSSRQKVYDVGFDACAVHWSPDGTQLVVDGNDNKHLTLRYAS